MSNPIAAPGINLFPAYSENEDKFLLGSKEKDRYIIVDRETGEYYLLLLNDLNGHLSIDELSNKWNLTVEITENLIKSFYKNGLLNTSPENKNTEVNRMSIRLFSIPCKKISNISQKVASTICVFFWIALSMGIVFDSYMLLTHKVGEFNVLQLSNSYLLSLIVSSLIMIPSFLFHELCHSIVALRYGVKPTKIDFCLYLFLFPLYYVRINGLYTVDYKKRIKIMSAGVFGNFFCGIIMFAMYSIFKYEIFLTIMLAQFNIILVNLNPFSLSDGYYIISMLLKTENLRKKMFDLIANFNFKKYKISDTVYLYVLINFLLIIVNVMYISKFSQGIIQELFRTELPTSFIPIVNVSLCVLYFMIVHFRFKASDK